MRKNKEGFVDSVISLMLSQGIIKIFGLAYSMYLINKEGFGDRGNAIYMGGYQIYVLLLTISSIGVPNAVAKLIAEKVAVKDYNGADKIFKIAFFSFGVIGFFGTILLFFSAKYISNTILLIPECEYSLIALSPSIFLVSISSVIRGYFNGISQISKTAKSQTIEQIFKSFLTIVLVEFLSTISKNTTSMASIANFASTCAILVSFIYILNSYIKLRKIQMIEKIKFSNASRENSIEILKRIFAVSIPITISAVLGTLNKNIDSITVVRILTPILGEKVAKLKYGILSSKIDILTVMPLSFNIAFATALVPTISSAFARNDIKTINSKLSFSLLISCIIAFPSAIGLSLYSKQILNLLFPNSSSGGDLLKISAFSIIFMSINQTINGALHGMGKTKISILVSTLGLIVKLVLNIILIPIINIYEKGAIIANLFSSFISFIVTWNVLKISIKINFNFLNLITKPLTASIIMGISSYNVYLALIGYGVTEKISTIFGIIFAILIYIILLLVLRIFSKKDLLLLPNGEKLYKFLKRVKIYY